MEKPRAKSRFSSPSCRLEDNIKIDFTAYVIKYTLRHYKLKQGLKHRHVPITGGGGGGDHLKALTKFHLFVKSWELFKERRSSY